MTELHIRSAAEEDLPSIARIQQLSPEAVSWAPRSYLQYECRVAAVAGAVAGFVVYRDVAGEYELLNIAVDPQFRHRGVGSALLREALARRRGTWFLEVRESNQVARRFYEKLGFSELSRRSGYYAGTGEAAVVMSLHSC